MNEAVVTLFITSFFRPYEASYIPQALAKIKFKDFQDFQHFRRVRIVKLTLTQIFLGSL